MEDEEKRHTRFLNDPGDATPMQERTTGPLDQVMPWVIEFRVVGTHHIIKIPVKEVMMIGRGDAKNNVFPDIDLTQYAAQALGVSRQHAAITVKDNRVTIRDLDSPNGTYINDHVLTPRQEYRLRNGDKLRFGRLHLQIHFLIKPTDSEQTQEITSFEDLNIPKFGKGQRFLLVDDDSEVASLIEMVLQYAGFKTTICSSVADAMTKVDQNPPDAVITELLLPDSSGLDLIHYIRDKVSGGSRIPIMAVSSASGGFQMNQAMTEGVDLFIGKPFAIEEFVRAIHKMSDEMTRE